jgi:hypothetical protein
LVAANLPAPASDIQRISEVTMMKARFQMGKQHRHPLAEIGDDRGNGSARLGERTGDS